MALPVIPIGLGLAGLMLGGQAYGQAQQARTVRDVIDQQKQALAGERDGVLAYMSDPNQFSPVERAMVISNPEGPTAGLEQLMGFRDTEADNARQDEQLELAREQFGLAVDRYQLDERVFAAEQAEREQQRIREGMPTDTDVAARQGAQAAAELAASRGEQMSPFYDREGVPRWQHAPGTEGYQQQFDPLRRYTVAYENLNEVRQIGQQVGRLANKNLISNADYMARLKAVQLTLKDVFGLGAIQGADSAFLAAVTADDIGPLRDLLRDNPDAFDANLRQAGIQLQSSIMPILDNVDEWYGRDQQLIDRSRQALSEGAGLDWELRQSQQREEQIIDATKDLNFAERAAIKQYVKDVPISTGVGASSIMGLTGAAVGALGLLGLGVNRLTRGQ